MTRTLLLALAFASRAAAVEDNGAAFGQPDFHTAVDLLSSEPLTRARTASLLLFSSANAQVLPNGKLRIGMAPSSLCNGVAAASRSDLKVGLPTCSAALITPNRVITAAHCLDFAFEQQDTGGPVDESRLRFLLDYTEPLKSVDGYAVVEPDRVRSVARTLYCKRSTQTDIAVLQLTDKVDNTHTPIPRLATRPRLGDAVHLISHPQGLPVRGSTCAVGPAGCKQALVRETVDFLLRAPMDSFRGSSGGAVVNGSGMLAGVFSGGLQDLTPSGDCDAEIRYSDDCAGDVASRVDLLPAALFDDGEALPDVDCDFGPAPDYSSQCKILDAGI